MDNYTVRVKTSEPFAELIENLASYVEMLPPKAAANTEEFLKKPIGTGPYKLVSRTANDKYEVAAAGPHWSGEPRMEPQTNWSSKIKGIAWQGYTNPQVDELIDKAAKTLDASARAKTDEDLMKIVWDEYPWIFLCHQQDLYGVRDRVKNFTPTSEALIRLDKTEVTG